VPESYFVVRDGGRYISRAMTREELLAAITPGRYTGADAPVTDYGRDLVFLRTLPTPGTSWPRGNCVVILKGEVVVPKPVDVVKSYEVP
jgi:hypothetical protein